MTSDNLNLIHGDNLNNSINTNCRGGRPYGEKAILR